MFARQKAKNRASAGIANFFGRISPLNRWSPSVEGVSKSTMRGIKTVDNVEPLDFCIEEGPDCSRSKRGDR
jgi:hypothetical protein